MRNSVLSFRCNRDVSLSQIREDHHLKNREMGRKRGGEEERRRDGAVYTEILCARGNIFVGQRNVVMY